MTEILSREQYEKMKEDANEAIKILCGIYELGQDLPPGEDRTMIAEAFSTVIRSLPQELLFAVVTNLVGERLSLIETVNILSDQRIVADLEESAADIAAGRTTLIDPEALIRRLQGQELPADEEIVR